MQAAPGCCYPALLHCMTQWRHHLHTCSPTCPHICPPTHLPTALRVELPSSEKASLARREEIDVFAHLGVGLLWAAFSLVALPSLARSSLPAGHRATETLAPAPALHAGEAAACTLHTTHPSTETHGKSGNREIYIYSPGLLCCEWQAHHSSCFVIHLICHW